MAISESFISSFRENPVEGTLLLKDLIRESIEQSQDWTNSDYAVLLEAYLLLAEAKELGLITYNTGTFFEPEGNIKRDCSRLNEIINSIVDECKVASNKNQMESIRKRLRLDLSNAFVYEFSQGDLERIQVLVTELRKNLTDSNSLEEGHRQRLLSRLEKLQSELHKKVSDLDRFWGIASDAIVLVGKLGEESKPLVDRFREIADIVWRTQARAEELPSGSKNPLLGNDQSPPQIAQTD